MLHPALRSRLDPWPELDLLPELAVGLSCTLELPNDPAPPVSRKNKKIGMDRGGSKWIRGDRSGSKWIEMDQKGSQWIAQDLIGLDWMETGDPTC
jgi:hypothetical protein